MKWHFLWFVQNMWSYIWRARYLSYVSLQHQSASYGCFVTFILLLSNEFSFVQSRHLTKLYCNFSISAVSFPALDWIIHCALYLQQFFPTFSSLEDSYFTGWSFSCFRSSCLWRRERGWTRVSRKNPLANLQLLQTPRHLTATMRYPKYFDYLFLTSQNAENRL